MKRCVCLLSSVVVYGALCSGAEQYAGWAVGAAQGGYATIIATSDSGAAWTRQGSGQLANADLDAVFAVNPMTAWAGGAAENGYATLYVTHDGGATWTRKGFGASALHHVDIAKIHVSSNHIWAIGLGVVLHSCDEGTTWTNVLPAAYTNMLLQGVCSVGGGTVWVGGEHPGGALLLHSTDAGQTWVRQTNGAVLEAGHILGISAVNTQLVWAVGGDGFVVLRTDNGGAVWNRQPSQGGLGDANEVSAVEEDTAYVAVDNFVEWSTNAGQTWDSQNTPYYTMGISAIGRDTAWAAVCGHDGTGSIWHTANGGATWQHQALEIVPLAPLWTVSFAREPVPEPAGWALIAALWAVWRRRHTR